MFPADHPDSIFRQITDNAFNIPANITDFGKFRGFHLDERSTDQFGQPAGYFGFTHAGGTDHQDILGNNLITQIFIDFASPVPVPESDGNGLFCFVLSDNEAVQLMHDLPGCQLLFIHCRISILQTVSTRI